MVLSECSVDVECLSLVGLTVLAIDGALFTSLLPCYCTAVVIRTATTVLGDC